MLEDVEEALNDVGGGGGFYGLAGGGAHEEGSTEGAGQPVGLAASGELIDDDAAVFLPGAGFGHGRAVGGVWLLGEQAVAKDEAAADKGVEVG